MKIAVGSANFEKKYTFQKQRFFQKEFRELNIILKKSKIDLIDTADNYKNYNKISQLSKIKNIKIVSKISFKKNYKQNLGLVVNKKINFILNSIKIKKIYAILFHNYNDILQPNGKEILKHLLKLKENKVIEKIGISIYDPKELDRIFTIFKPDIVQAPMNVLDQRLHRSNWLNQLKKENIEIHIRSCFLQGLLIDYDLKAKINKRFTKWQKKLDNWNNWCKKNKISNIKACLDFLKKFKNIDYVVVGFNNTTQLLDLIKIFKSRIKFIPNKFNCIDKNLIEPKNW